MDMNEKELLLRTPEYIAAIQEAIHLLAWWADDESDNPEVRVRIDRSKVTGKRLTTLLRWLDVPAAEAATNPAFRLRLQKREARRRHAARGRGLDVPKRPPGWKSKTKPFWTYVDKSNIDGCWTWKSSKRRGYGTYSYRMKRYGAHVWSWQLAHDRPVPKGMVIMHTCDNRSCVRPDHLRLGTVRENIDDKIAKGRQAMGETTGSAKLTEDQVRDVRLRNPTGKARPAMARALGISVTALHDILNKRTWKHVAADRV